MAIGTLSPLDRVIARCAGVSLDVDVGGACGVALNVEFDCEVFWKLRGCCCGV